MSPALSIASTLGDYVAERETVVIAIERLRRTATRLRGTIGDTDLADRTALAAAVSRHVEARRGAGVSDGTIRRELITLRAAVRGAWKRGLLTYQPYVSLPSAAPGRQRWLTPSEARSLLMRCDGDLYTFVLIALTTGARRGAILDLTWERVDFRRGVIDFRAPHPLAARRKHRAIVPMAPILRRELERDLQRCCRLSARVVPLGPTSVERLMRSAAAAAGLPGVTAHTLRHTAATWMLGDGTVPLPQASRMLGHQSSAITEQVYAHLITDHLVPAAQLLGRLVEG